MPSNVCSRKDNLICFRLCIPNLDGFVSIRCSRLGISRGCGIIKAYFVYSKMFHLKDDEASTVPYPSFRRDQSQKLDIDKCILVDAFLADCAAKCQHDPNRFRRMSGSQDFWLWPRNATHYTTKATLVYCLDSVSNHLCIHLCCRRHLY